MINCQKIVQTLSLCSDAGASAHIKVEEKDLQKGFLFVRLQQYIKTLLLFRLSGKCSSGHH